MQSVIRASCVNHAVQALQYERNRTCPCWRRGRIFSSCAGRAVRDDRGTSACLDELECTTDHQIKFLFSLYLGEANLIEFRF